MSNQTTNPSEGVSNHTSEPKKFIPFDKGHITDSDIESLLGYLSISVDQMRKFMLELIIDNNYKKEDFDISMKFHDYFIIELIRMMRKTNYVQYNKRNSDIHDPNFPYYFELINGKILCLDENNRTFLLPDGVDKYDFYLPSDEDEIDSNTLHKYTYM